MRHRRVEVLILVAGAVAGCSERSAPPPMPSSPGVSVGPADRPAVSVRAPKEQEAPMARALREALVREVASSPPWDGSGPWDPKVIEAMRTVPRHLFAPDLPLPFAYENRAAPIGHGQTISQPQVVAMMTQALSLQGAERVLEIGTGSGYQAAVLSGLCREVYTIEIVAPLGEAARERLAKLGYSNVQVKIGDGYQGWPEHAPFDRVILTAAPPEMPAALVDQLATGGVIVAPVGELPDQVLVRWRKTAAARIEREKLADVQFVPMVHGDAPTR